MCAFSLRRLHDRLLYIVSERLKFFLLFRSCVDGARRHRLRVSCGKSLRVRSNLAVYLGFIAYRISRVGYPIPMVLLMDRVVGGLHDVVLTPPEFVKTSKEGSGIWGILRE